MDVGPSPNPNAIEWLPMAGTDDDNNTSNDWPLAGAELAFFTEHVGSERLAKELLFDGLDEGSIRWSCRELAVDEAPDFSLNPPLVTSLAAARQFFWHRAMHSRIDVDWLSHRVIRIGPVIRLGSDGNSPIFDMRGSATLTASLVRFCHGDGVNYLVTLGLMPRSHTAPQKIAPTAPRAALSPSEPPQEPQPEVPKPPPMKAKAWVPYAIKQWPQKKGEDQSDYVDRLMRHAPRRWAKHTIQNLL